jgi:molybdate transport system substrate-binding protein
MKSLIILAVTAVLFMTHDATAGEVSVLASPGMREALLDLIPAFESAGAHKVVVTWSGTQNVRKQVAAGEVYDLVIVETSVLEDLINEGHIVRANRVDIMKSAVGAAVRAGAPKPDIGSAEALKKTLLAAGSIGYSSGPSGTHIVELFQRMGIAQQIKAKLKQTAPGLRVASAIASGEIEIGFQQVSELIHETGVDYIGPLPADLQKITIFSAGIHSKAREPKGAQELVNYVTSPAAAPVIRKHGLEPA